VSHYKATYKDPKISRPFKLENLNQNEGFSTASWGISSVVGESTSNKIDEQLRQENKKILSCRINAVKQGRVTFLKPNVTTSNIKKGNTDQVLFSKPGYMTGKCFFLL